MTMRKLKIASQSHGAAAMYHSGDVYMCANLRTYHSTPPSVYLLISVT